MFRRFMAGDTIRINDMVTWSGDAVVNVLSLGDTMQQLERDVGEILENLKDTEAVQIRKGEIRLRSSESQIFEFSTVCDLREKVTGLRDFLRERKKHKEREWRKGDELSRVDDSYRYILVELIEGTGDKPQLRAQRIGSEYNISSNIRDNWRNLTKEAEAAAEK